MDKLATTPKFEYPFPGLKDKSVVPDGDIVWNDLIALRTYLQKIEPMLVAMEKKIEEQQIEIEKLKKHVSNRVQKIEIVRFLGEDQLKPASSPMEKYPPDYLPKSDDDD